MTTQVCSIGEYVRAMTKNPMLADKLKGSEDKFSKDKDGGGDKRFLFPEHLSPHAINVGVKSKAILQGVFYLSRTNYLEATVNCEGVDGPVLVQGLQNQVRERSDHHHRDQTSKSVFHKNRTAPWTGTTWRSSCWRRRTGARPPS